MNFYMVPEIDEKHLVGNTKRFSQFLKQEQFSGMFSLLEN